MTAPGTTRLATPATIEQVAGSAQAMAPAIAERSREIEASRRIPADLLEDLVGAGMFRVLLPVSHGGVGADLPDALRVFETLAAADASVGWTVMIGASSWCDLAGLPRDTFDALFPADRPVIVAGAFNPAGSLAPVDGGYRVSGRWGFASGCQHADWLYGNCVEGFVDGVPHLRGAVFAPDDIVIEDTWHVSGLSGTGSHHFTAADVFVPADRTFVPLSDDPCLPDTIVHFPAPALFALGIATVAIGTAAGALADIVALATDKVPLLAGAPLAGSPVFQAALATADTELRAARGILAETAEGAWAAVAAGRSLTLEERARLRAAAVWATDRSTAVVGTAYRSGGGTSIYADCPLQRRMRDVQAMSQHFLVRPDTMATAGAILAGQGLTVPVF